VRTGREREPAGRLALELAELVVHAHLGRLGRGQGELANDAPERGAERHHLLLLRAKGPDQHALVLGELEDQAVLALAQRQPRGRLGQRAELDPVDVDGGTGWLADDLHHRHVALDQAQELGQLRAQRRVRLVRQRLLAPAVSLGVHAQPLEAAHDVEAHVAIR
jgi:hypothetical protein